MKAHSFFALFFTITTAVQAFDTLESEFRTNGNMMHAVVTRAQQSLQEFSAVIYEGRKEAGYGIVASEEGYILGKLSELKPLKEIKIRVGDQEFSPVALVAEDVRWDVALLKIDAKGLKPAVFAETSDIGQGSWVVANGATSRSERRPMVGILSANFREIRVEGGAVLGIELKEDKEKIIVGNLPEISGAFKAGIRQGDIIVSLGGKKMKNRAAIAEFMKDRRVGEKLEVSYIRDGKEQKAEVELAGRADTYGIEKSRNDTMSGDVSKRRSGFPRVLQHDVQGTSKTVGGPLVDLDGKCIGMNIARANRAESFAIPVEELREISQRLLEEARKK
jgi:S1-C subfamily serine protease